MIMMADRKKTVAAILGPHPDMEKDEDKSGDSLKICAEEAIDAIHAKDAEGFLEAMKSIFQELDSEPHEEGPHIGG
jgi:hypothetical protein